MFSGQTCFINLALAMGLGLGGVQADHVLVGASALRALARGGWHTGGTAALPAFADRLLATPDTRIALSHLRHGRIPQAGGTVSLTRRMGRWRTAALAPASTPQVG